MPAAASPELDALSATTCVVTGGLGFIGSNMVHALASRRRTRRASWTRSSPSTAAIGGTWTASSTPNGSRS